jgi:hypothetical protein
VGGDDPSVSAERADHAGPVHDLGKRLHRRLSCLDREPRHDVAVRRQTPEKGVRGVDRRRVTHLEEFQG